MENEQDIRWKQRFSNFEKAFANLKSAITELENPSDLEKEGTIQRFEFTHELAWKVMKDYLNDQGIQGIIGSKDATRYAFQNEIISNGDAWMEMIKSRNETVHTYEPKILEVEYIKIKSIYYPLFEQFHKKMKSLL